MLSLKVLLNLAVMVVAVTAGAKKNLVMEQRHQEGHRLAMRSEFRDVRDPESFSYNGEKGPQFWSELSEENALCGSGQRQSPINLNRRPNNFNNTRGLTINWEPLLEPGLVNNGRTWEVDVASAANGTNALSHLMFDGARYDLLQFHFHSNSEHRVSERSLALEMHGVHQNAAGDLLALSIFFRVSRIDANRFLDQFWTSFPTRTGTAEFAGELAFEDLLSELDEPLQYWTYIGSLTTPPCTEGVQWVVLNSQQKVSISQLNRFARSIGFNARPTQPVNDRI